MSTQGGQKKVAVLGASGIGRHHANWWALEGGDVCAFLGSSPASIAATRDVLAEMFGFEGRGYDSLGDLLTEEEPDIVDVCTPNACHYAHAEEALGAGCDVLCEKPFVYERGVARDELLDKALGLTRLAEDGDQLFGLCTQYYVTGELIRGYWAENAPEQAITGVTATLASPFRERPPGPVDVWVDLGPHLIAALQALFPGSTVDWASVETEFQDYLARATFTLKTADGQSIHSELTTNRTFGDPSHVRRLCINECPFEIQGTRDADGAFCSKIVSPLGTFIESDSLRLLVRRFLGGEAAVGPSTALANLDRMLRFIEVAGLA
ncbi:MAG: Gfo/Idh/MocA family oxidoreductase [Lentisphaerae bacterium]|jgi:predicted dehydrogenase|nr:Gfo/Idh/MocA family oxidoreductase [Lentisphaerota bacterium]MBT4819517.1 Gfo/Idh/MocA family oxidoreductase [Lentisphaerota bacterium]MBT5610392.1 Gfo/Idh/MocA family oxidoreductase [Lentisphaerota bacterium]MBT7056220.1 Gfo/Idh/MocA family oxidoreductase [Lentisphaerota bacterium]MBT7841858.1 Gfo/Idh/MocA family oxidoreductase [Lentisphaerota bacterium]